MTAQLIGRTQTSTGAATTISQQAMLLGNRPANCNQAQMYLRTQMVWTFSNISSCLSYWYNETCNFSISNQLATCLSLLFAFLLSAYSNPCSHGGCCSIRPPCHHLLLLFTYLLSGINFVRHKIKITHAKMWLLGFWWMLEEPLIKFHEMTR